MRHYFVVKAFLVSLVFLAISSNLPISSFDNEEDDAEEVTDFSFNTTIETSHKMSTNIDAPSAAVKVIYFVTQHDSKSKGKKQIKYSENFFKQSKLIASLFRIREHGSS